MKKMIDGWKPFWPKEAEEIKDFSGAEWKLYTYMRIRAHPFTFYYSGTNLYLAKVLKMDKDTVNLARLSLRKKGKIRKITQIIDHIPKAKFYKEQAIEEVKRAQIKPLLSPLTKERINGKSVNSNGKSVNSNGKSVTYKERKNKQTKAGGKDLFVRNKNFKILIRWLTEQNQGRDMTKLAIGAWKKYGEKTIERAIKVVERAPNPNLTTFWEAVKKRHKEPYQKPGEVANEN